MDNHRAWLVRTTKNASFHDIDRKTGINHSGLARKFREGKPLSAEQVIAIATAYGHSSYKALVETGFLPDESDRAETPEEISARIQADIEKLERLAEEKSNIIPIRPRHEYDPTQGIPDDAVADNSPDTKGDLDDLDP